jgi:hypothetical protein
MKGNDPNRKGYRIPAWRYLNNVRYEASGNLRKKQYMKEKISRFETKKRRTASGV